jgi:hypothetical protein
MRVAMIAIALVFSASVAAAQTSAEIHACHGDAVRLCGAPRSGDVGFFEALRIKVCMLARRNEVSSPCRAVFKAHGL